jgi:hypothetical protein
MNEQRLQLIAEKRYEFPDTRFDDLRRNTSEEEIELYSRTLNVVEAIIKWQGRTRASKIDAQSSRYVAKRHGDLHYVDTVVSKPTRMGVLDPEGNELLGEVDVHKHYARETDSRFPRFRLADRAGSLAVRFFTYDSSQNRAVLYRGIAIPITPEDGVSGMIRGASHLSNLQALEEIALSVDQIHAAAKY